MCEASPRSAAEPPVAPSMTQVSQHNAYADAASTIADAQLAIDKIATHMRGAGIACAYCI